MIVKIEGLLDVDDILFKEYNRRISQLSFINETITKKIEEMAEFKIILVVTEAK